MSQLPVGASGQPIPVVRQKYRLVRRLGGGSFGDIYLGDYIPTNEKVAIKFEKQDARCPQLRHEYKVYRELQHCVGFGKVHHFDQQDGFNVMVMELLGYSLEDLFNKCGRRFSLKTVLQLADQVLERVETMHSRHLIHRDIKPANFVIGYHNTALVHCIDFGLSKRYRHPRTLQHIPYRDGRSLTGTPRYASINNHLGIEQSRRDDLESIGYVLIYFLRGVLPWQGLKAKTASKKYKMIMEKKQSVSIPELCQGCPVQFAEYLTYCRSLSFDSKPDMQYLRGLFRDLYVQQGYGTTGSEWDWDRFIQPYGGLGLTSADEPLRPPPAPSRPLPTTAALQRSADAMDTTEPKALAVSQHAPQQGAGGAVDMVLADAHRWRASTAPATQQQGHAAGGGGGHLHSTGGHGLVKDTGAEPGVVMMQTVDPDEQEGHVASPLNKLNQSLRISDDDGRQGHKRHLSHTQRADGGDGGNPGTAWGDYKQHLGSRPKTAHGTRVATGRSTTAARPGTAGGPNYCRKCGKVTTGSSSTACGCGGSSGQLASSHVVAGARGMMRYRRTRAATVEATPLGAPDAAGAHRGSTTITMTSGSGGSKTRASVSVLVGRGAPTYTTSTGGGGAKTSTVKQETFFNGVWKKAPWAAVRPRTASSRSGGVSRSGK